MTGKIIQYLAIAATACMATAHASMRTDLLGTFNHTRIEFYGKVVDHTGAPLPGVAVLASVIYNSGVAAGVAKKQTATLNHAATPTSAAR